MNFGATEIILILGIIILFFGASKIPELARGLGQGFNEFRKASDDSNKEIEDEPAKEDEKDVPKP